MFLIGRGIHAMADFGRKGSVQDVGKSMKDVMSNTDTLTDKLGRSSSNLERLSQMERDLTADLPYEDAHTLAQDFRFAYQQGRNDYKDKDARLGAQLRMETEHLRAADKMAKDANADAQTLERVAQESKGSLIAERASAEAYHLTEITDAIKDVVQSADIHLRHSLEKKVTIDKEVGRKAGVRHHTLNNSGVVGPREYKPPLPEYKPPLKEYHSPLEAVDDEEDRLSQWLYNRSEAPADDPIEE